MAKSIRSKVKKELRTVKRGVIKRELATPGSKLNVREVAKAAKSEEALSGHIKPPPKIRNAFRYDDADAVIPQHNFRQGPDFRSLYAGPEAGYAVVGSNRPKQMLGGDAPTAAVATKPGAMEPDDLRNDKKDNGLRMQLRSTEQIVPLFASKKLKKRLKNQVKNKSGTDNTAAFRWC